MNHKPKNIALLYLLPKDEVLSGKLEPRGLWYGGPVFAGVGGEGPEIVRENGHLLVDGHLYRFKREARGRLNGKGWDVARVYQLVEGWQVLIDLGPDDPIPGRPQLLWPVWDRGLAVQTARDLATRYRAAAGSPIRTRVVWQQGETYGEPVAECDAGQYDRERAIRLKLAGETLPLTMEVNRE